MAAYVLSYFTWKQSQKEFTISFIPYHSLVTDPSDEQVHSRWKDGKWFFVFFCLEHKVWIGINGREEYLQLVLPLRVRRKIF